MIHRISSTLPTFKNLTLQGGLNLVLADKSPGATDRQTRNSAGKSSLIEIIHFVLGADCKPDSIFRGETLVDHAFSLDFDLGRQRAKASRTGSSANRIIVDASDSTRAVQPRLDKFTGETSLSNAEWKAVLGSEMFALRADDDKYGPSLRSLLSYFVRRESAGGFQNAEQQTVKQNIWDVQVSLSCLLGLDWEISRSLQRVRLKEKTLQTLKKESESDSGVLEELVGRAGELRTRLTVAETKVRKLREELDGFQVLPEYHELEKEASSLAIEISALTNQNALDRERIEAIQEQLSDEPVPRLPDIKRVYHEAQIVLPDLVMKRLADVE